ncbi:MAG: hypothetical protein ACOYJG_09640 [Prevotella sp.]
MNAQNLYVDMKSGETIIFQLSASPKIHYEGDSFIATGDGKDISAGINEVERYYFKDDLTSIQKPETDSESNGLNVKNGYVTATGLAMGQQLCVSNLSGQVLRRAEANDRGVASLSLIGLPSGVYIVNAGKASLKLSVK